MTKHMLKLGYIEIKTTLTTADRLIEELLLFLKKSEEETHNKNYKIISKTGNTNK